MWCMKVVIDREISKRSIKVREIAAPMLGDGVKHLLASYERPVSSRERPGSFADVRVRDPLELTDELVECRFHARL